MSARFLQDVTSFTEKTEACSPGQQNTLCITLHPYQPVRSGCSGNAARNKGYEIKKNDKFNPVSVQQGKLSEVLLRYRSVSYVSFLASAFRATYVYG